MMNINNLLISDNILFRSIGRSLHVGGDDRYEEPLCPLSLLATFITLSIDYYKLTTIDIVIVCYTLEDR